MNIQNWEDFVEVDAQGNIVQRNVVFDAGSVNLAAISANIGVIEATATPLPGSLSGTEAADVIAVQLTAGQTYSFDYRGAVGGIEDPFLALFGPAGVNDAGYITEDDDGGAGRGSLITYTATETGTHYLYATSFYTIDTGNPSLDTGAYTINVWSPEADVPGSTNVVASIATATSLGLGTYYGNLDSGTDNDYFAVTVEAGQVYTFNYSGGVWGAGDFDGEPGENLATLTLYGANGQQIGTNLNYESGLSYFAATDATVYVRVQSYAGTTGGYTLDVGEVDPSTRDPLESLNWDSADNIDTVEVDGVPTAYVYFGQAGENFGEAVANQGWTPAQADAVMAALQNEYTPITGIQYLRTMDPSQAEFRMITVTTATYGARFYPQDPAYGSQQGIGTFNLGSGGFGAFPQSLVEGGYSYAVILHEFGHAHGVAHPHDTGGGSEIMLGVTAATDSYGVYNLNQGAYTVMSYNDAWDFHPDGPSAFTVAGIDNGWSGSLGAFDIAVLQARYGAHDHNEGNDVYALTDVTDDAFYQTIWDTGGTDTIAYGGAFNAQIDLTAATLDYTPTGGGVLSFLYNPRPLAANSTLVRGGYTIANGVEIENATGGSGNDALLGNALANVLTGNAGDDTLLGRGGNDQLFGGSGNDRVQGGDGLDVVNLGTGNDVFVAELGTTRSTLRTGSMSVDIITDFDAAGDDLIDLSGLGSFTFRGTSNSRYTGDLTYKTYTSVNGAENALGIDIDGNPGASNVSGPVTVVYGNTNGGPADFAIILLNTRSVDASDFIFASATTTAQTSTTASSAAVTSLSDTAGLHTLNASIAHEYLL